MLLNKLQRSKAVVKFQIFPRRITPTTEPLLQTYWWRLKSANGRIVAGSTEGYASVAEANRSIIRLLNYFDAYVECELLNEKGRWVRDLRI